MSEEQYPAETMVKIPYKEYKRLLDAEAMLQCLEGVGVDNWDGYDYAIEMFEEAGGEV